MLPLHQLPMAEVDGFEPPNMGGKTPCLTAWQYLNVEALLGIEPRPKGLEASVLTVTPWGSIEGLVARTKPVNYI